MRLLTILILILSFNIIIAQSSKKFCHAPVIEFDLNSISKKCGSNKVKSSSSTKSKTTTQKRSSKRYYIKKKKAAKESVSATSINSNNEVELEFKKIEISNITTTNEVLFSLVEIAPSFPNSKCIGDIKCFNKDVKKHFLTNFYPERASDDGINGRVFIQFVVNTKGDLNNLIVKGPKNATRLEKEVRRVLSKMPKLIPGRHQSLPVNVKYSLPINFSAI